jgi:perosamine synthetase
MTPGLAPHSENAPERFLPVAEPLLVGREREYVLECLDSTWISSNGPFIERFEQGFAEQCGVEHAISCSNGTVALHLSLLGLGVGPGDEVICPTLTYVASANCVTYCGATPVFVDSEPLTWNMDADAVRRAITPRTRAIVAVHLYGHPVDMDPIREIAASRGLAVVEDAAEALGATYRGRPAGSLGDVATFSFYGNKLLTTGEGGMVITNDETLARHIRQLRGQGQDLERRYWFPIVGFNYRMTNVAAAIGLAQLERVDWHVARRRENATAYRSHLARSERLEFSPEAPWAQSSFWMSSVLIRDASQGQRDEVMAHLAKRRIETRPFFYPMHLLPPYRDLARDTYPVADDLSSRGMNLPSGAGLTEQDIGRVCNVLEETVAATVSR